jgi:hypothetical protein
VLAAVDAAVAEVEPDDAVIGGDGLGRETVEHTGGDPLVASRPQRRVGHGTTEQLLDIDPRAAGDEPDQDPFEAGPIRDARPVTAQRMGTGRRREQTFDGVPDGIDHFGLERANDVQVPPPGRRLMGSTRHQNRAITTTGGWSPQPTLYAYPRGLLADIEGGAG